MPILKVPVVHKFGIISHCQRLNLQSRLLNETNLSKVEEESPTARNPFELTDEFVERYNTASADDKRKMVDLADKIFSKVKRRIGLQHNCESEPHINVALGWTDLTILSQCQGDISEKSLDLLYLSLSVAPVQSSTFFVLFFLLETALYFLQTSKLQPRHPEKHIKWLQIAEIVSFRIYIQCKLFYSQCPKEKLDTLKLYMQDFERCQSDFSKYPEAAVSFCVIEELCKYLSDTFDESSTKDSSASAHELSSLLWHCVDLWQCSFYSTHRSQIKDSVESIQHCLAHNSSFGNWIDCYSSFRVLANVARFQKFGLEIFESIILGLAEANSEMEQKGCNDENEDGLPLKENDSEKVCGYERGTLLLFTAIREFSFLPLVCLTSEEREMSLSNISEWLLSVNKDSIFQLPITAKKIVTSRLKAILELIESSVLDSRFTVIKNALWFLLESVQRKNILQKDLTDCLQYGQIVSSLMFSRELAANPQFINERISQAIARHIFPVAQPSDAHQLPIQSVKKNKSNDVTNKCKNNKPNIHLPQKRSVTGSGRTPLYITESNKKLKNITHAFWEANLPDIEKKLEETEITDK